MSKSYTQLAIERAIEGGYKIPSVVDSSELDAAIRFFIKYPFKLFFDPSFWRALGKSKKWSKLTDLPNPDWTSNLPVFDDELEHDTQETWLYHQHRFIDHLAADKDPESFFRELLANEKITKKYILIDGRNPKWAKVNDETGEIISTESYTHQDDNFSNMCCSEYCRCQQ